MNNLDTRSDSGAQAPSWCTSPFAKNLDADDRLDHLRALGAAVRLQFRSHPNLSDSLTLAVLTGDDVWLEHVHAELLRLPSPQRRRLLAGLRGRAR